MRTIEVDFDVFKALTARRANEAVTENDVLRSLLGLNAKQAAHAIALTATSIGGLSKAAATSIAREYHAGLATLLGIEAALAARRGFTGELAILEVDRGFVSMFGNTS